VARGRGSSKPPFVTTTYEADEDGRLRPVIPSRCVFAAGAERCSLFVDHYRPRKTGPRFALAVVGCSAHPDRRYTLYPPGHFPHGRQPVAPYSPTGELLLDPRTGDSLTSRPQGPDRDDSDAILPFVSQTCSHDHTQHRGLSALRDVYAFGEGEEVLGCVFHLPRP